MIVSSFRIQALFINLGIFLIVALPSTGLATDCSKVPKACSAKCERFNMATSAVDCWCSGTPSGCWVDATRCTHANSIQDIAYDELIACIKSCGTTSISGSASSSTGSDAVTSCDLMSEDYVQELLDFLQR